ncbi:hypothetical protein PYJP_05390 [Pyrofollis japonicus]|uniref:restriction endonuclease n=1 Tax=Pyrofollis japonicus TaxID=3060460 RepID=UPI00295A8A90|nr:restriction endonuclease [Pyrofollis japonicus]BEP17187.1 hypothetical protein PYJP_05390 [Pyrofollis japonicus]
MLDSLRSVIGALVAELLRLRSEKCVSLDAIATRLFIRSVLVKRAAELLSAEPGAGAKLVDGEICIEDALALALTAVRLGVPETAISKSLDWRLFEEYARRAFSEAGYRVYRGLRVAGRGGLELDVLALAEAHAVAIDCKHWEPKYTVPSRLRDAARRHVERIRRLEKYWDRLGLPQGCWRIVPALIVIKENVPKIIEGVFIVPVSKLRGFIEELPVLLEAEEAASLKICSKQTRLF